MMSYGDRFTTDRTDVFAEYEISSGLISINLSPFSSFFSLSLFLLCSFFCVFICSMVEIGKKERRKDTEREKEKGREHGKKLSPWHDRLHGSFSEKRLSPRSDWTDGEINASRASLGF